MIKRQVDLVFGIDSMSGAPLAVSGATFSAYNTWDAQWVDFSLSPPQCSASVVSGSVAMSALTDIETSASTHAIYSLNTSGLSDGEYLGVMRCSGYQDTVSFSVLDGIPYPEWNKPGYGNFVVSVSAVTVSSSGINGCRHALYRDGVVHTQFEPLVSGNVASAFVPAGTWQLFTYKDFYTFQPSTVVVTADTSVAVTGSTVFTPTPASTAASSCVVYGTVMSLGMSATSGVVFTFRAARIPQYADSSFIMKLPITCSSSTGGYFSARLPWGVDVIVESVPALPRYQFTVPEVATIDLKELLDGDA